MKNFFKSNWIAITVCLVWALLATGGAIFFIKKSAQEHHAASLKMAEELQTTGAALEKAGADAAITKAAWDKEKALNEDLKKMVAEADTELEKLRNTLKTMASSPAKASKPTTTAAATATAAKAPASAATPDCRTNDSKFSKSKIKALQNYQADMHRRDKELKEKQQKLDEAMDHVAREKRKLILQNSEYRWPHDAEPARKLP